LTGVSRPRAAFGLGRREKIAAALVLLCVLAGVAMRVAAVSSRYGAGEWAGGDVHRYYVSVARSFLEGRGWVTDYEWNFIPPPGQAAFLVAVWSVLPGDDYLTARAVQAAVSALTILLAGWVGLRMGGPAAAGAAAAFLALDRNVVEYVGVLLAETNYFFLLLLFLALLLEAVRRRSPWWSAAAGGSLALAALFKPFPMFLALVVPVWLLARHRDRRALRDGAIFLLAFLVPVCPWLVRNHLRYGGFYLISTNAGTLLAQSNFPGLDPADPGQVYWESIYRTDRWRDPAIEERFRGRVDRYGQKEWNERDRAYMKYAVRTIVAHPLRFARNFSIKLVNALVYPAPGRGDPWHPSDLFRVVMLVLGLPGLAWFAVARRRDPSWIMVPVFVYFAGFTALMHIVRSGRINLPLKVLLLLFAAWLAGRAAERVLFRSGPPLTRRPAS
jgi:4-amino-4-deoxy-L-arabinose transferase-like glycosyltransferase